MNEAIEAVTRGMPVATAAKTYGVLRVTLLYKCSGKSPKTCKMGPATILTDHEESVLVEWILSLNRMHYPVTKKHLLDSVQRIIQETKRNNSFTENRPGRKWYHSFLKRHPVLSERIAQNLTPSREKVGEAHNPKLRNWFLEIEEYLSSKNLLEITNEPERIFNSDESAFFLQPKGEKVLARKGDRFVYNAGTNDEKENLTVLVTANASGDLAPPMIVFAYERIPGYIANSVNPTWGLGRSDHGWMCGSTFYEYITNVFEPWLTQKRINRPILLFVDGHVSHLTLQLSQFCARKGIELLALYPNSTHIIQPMDVSVFKPLKTFWRNEVKRWRLENSGDRLRKEHFGKVFEAALNKISRECIQNGFKACGLSPFNVENVNFKKMPERESEPPFKKEEFKEALKVIHKLISKETLAAFINFEKENEWNGPVEDTSLFQIWATLRKGEKKDMDLIAQNTEGDTNETEEAVRSITENEAESKQENVERLGDISVDKIEVDDKLTNAPKIIIHSQHILCAPSTKSENLNKSQPNVKTPDKVNLKENGPSPFKKALFWPEPKVKEKRRYNKEKIPSAITSQAWQEYHSKKENEKKRKLEEKENRARERAEKKNKN
ncbi:hypothetical protein NQ315_005717 [Exocentrus adspersus]|uniref:HTH CENPB-type domain-containing protein n=1 Tax=Exocentrus adspersus TaxID=1586481 RepID=A0AAV8VI43_9CUCU|nr:hypothetical protein NQ315_005717 [Exocentrus adspersus]